MRWGKMESISVLTSSWYYLIGEGVYVIFPLDSYRVNYYSICFLSQALSRCHNPHRTTTPILHRDSQAPEG